MFVFGWKNLAVLRFPMPLSCANQAWDSSNHTCVRWNSSGLQSVVDKIWWFGKLQSTGVTGLGAKCADRAMHLHCPLLQPRVWCSSWRLHKVNLCYQCDWWASTAPDISHESDRLKQGGANKVLAMVLTSVQKLLAQWTCIQALAWIL